MGAQRLVHQGGGGEVAAGLRRGGGPPAFPAGLAPVLVVESPVGPQPPSRAVAAINNAVVNTLAFTGAA